MDATALAMRTLCAAACLAVALAVGSQPLPVSPASGASADATPVGIARLTQLEDKPLREARGGRVGEFEDVVFELQSGRILHAVISVERGSGKDEAEFAVPLRDLAVNRPGRGDRSEPRLVLSVPPDTLPPAAKPATGSPYASGEGLLDDPIRSASGESLAEVKDVLIDFRVAKVSHVLVELENSKSARGHLVIVDVGRLQRPEGSEHLVFDGTADHLAALPSIAKDKLDTTDFATLR